MGAELFNANGRTDTQTDMKKLTVTFRSFANAPKTVTKCRISQYSTHMYT